MNSEQRIGPVLVVGSANIDVSVTTAVLPAPGETVPGDSAVISVGGKGANQAVAAASCGAVTDFVGRIGTDAFGRLVLEGVGARGVRHQQLRAIPGAMTGMAAIYVDHAGQNCIVVVGGANQLLSPADLEPLVPLIEASALVVLQCETPMPTVHRTIELAGTCGTQVLLNPAPCRGLDLAGLPPGITYLVPNESEAAHLTGMPVTDIDSAEACAERLVETGIPCVIITLGALGCVIADGAGTRHIAAFKAQAIDTTGAGDAFIGCFAASLASGRTRDDAARRAALYASLSTTRRGAQLSYPLREEFEQAWTRWSGGTQAWPR